MKTTSRGTFCAIGRDTRQCSSSSTARFVVRGNATANKIYSQLCCCFFTLQYNREFDRDERGGNEVTIDDYLDFTEEEEAKEGMRIKGGT